MRRRRALQVVGGVFAGTLSGCTADRSVFDTYRHERDAPVDGPVATPWQTLGYDSRRSGYNPYGWLPQSAEVSAFAYAGRQSDHQPAFVVGTAYFGSRKPDNRGIGINEGLAGLRAADSEEESWFFQADATIASPTVVGNAVLVTSAGTTRAVDTRDGALCWEYHEGTARPSASPTVVDDTVYVTGERVFALTASTGEVRWATDTLQFRPRGTAATTEGVFATAGNDERGAVYRFDTETGSEKWVTPTSGMTLAPPVLGKLVYVVEAEGRLRALDPSDGTEVWSRELGGPTTAIPAVADRTVYAVASAGSTLTAFDAFTGTMRWEFPFEGRRAVGPTVGSSAVYLPTSTRQSRGLVHAVAPETGEVRESYELPAEPRTPLVLGPQIGLVNARGDSSSTWLYALSQPGPYN